MKNSYSRQGQQSRSANARAVTKPAVFAFLLALIGASIPLHAATAPPATLLFTAPGPIQGGVATIGSSGVTYFCTLSAGQSPSTIFVLNLSGSVKWTNAPLNATNMFAVPALDAAGQKLYIGSDGGFSIA